jgi:hypothetical protein
MKFTARLVSWLALLTLIPALALAAPIDLSGFEGGTSEVAQGSTGTFSVQNSTVRTGGFALRVNPATTNAGWWRLGVISADGTTTGSSIANAYIRFYFRYATKAAANDEEIFQSQDFGGGLPKIAVRLNSAGNLAAYNSLNALMSTGSTVLSSGTWYRIEVYSGTGAAGSWAVRVDGVTEISGTGNLQTNNNATYAFGKVTNRNGNSVDYFYDDILIDNADYPGVGKIVALRPDGNGSTQDCSAGTGASNHLEVDEVPSDSDTTYVKNSGAGAGQICLMTLPSANSVSISGAIRAVKGTLYAREDISVTSSNSIRIRTNGTNSSATGTNLSTSYAARQRLLTVDPSDSGAFSAADIDNTEIGMVEANAVSMRATMMYLQVAFDDTAVTLRNLTSTNAGN